MANGNNESTPKKQRVHLGGVCRGDDLQSPNFKGSDVILDTTWHDSSSLSHFDRLADELLQHIFAYIKPYAPFFRLVCKRFNALARRNCVVVSIPTIKPIFCSIESLRKKAG